MSDNTTIWPKQYLLQLYERAVSEGCIRVNLEHDEKKFKSLKAAFYRLRRRKDAQHVAFIRPEFHLCVVSYERERGSMLITYNTLPDGQDLPAIESVESTSIGPDPRINIPEPVIALAEPAPDFDSTAHVRALLQTVNIEGENKGGTDAEPLE